MKMFPFQIYNMPQ